MILLYGGAALVLLGAVVAIFDRLCAWYERRQTERFFQ